MSHIDDDSVIGAGLPYLNANASSAACFEFKESKDAKPQEFKTVRGVILGAWRGNSCWPLNNDPDFSGSSPFCKASDARQPAQLRAGLTPGEMNKLRDLAHSGECASCGLSAKGSKYFKPEQHIVFLWESPTGPKPVMLTFKGWKGFLAVGAFLGTFRGRNAHDYIVEFTMERRSEGNNNYGAPTCREVGPVPSEQREELAALADATVPAARHRAPSAPPSLPSAPPRRALPPAEGDVVEVDDIPF